MSVLIIGGSGYIGSHLSQKLCSQNIPVTVWDLQAPPSSNSSQLEFVQRNFLSVDSSDLRKFETVVLLAGVSSVRAAQADPGLAIQSNIEGLVRLIGAVGEKLLIYASSGSVYDGCGGHPATEGSPLSQPRNVYDLSKQAGDEIATLYGERWLGLRFGTVNGVSPRIRTDLVVNRMTLTACQSREVEVSNPHVHRSILCVDDLVNFLSKLVHDQPDASYSGVLNLASFNATIGEIGASIANQLGATIVERPATSTYNFSMSTTKARAMFGFNPSTTIETLVKSLEAHYRSNQIFGKS